MMGPVSFQAGFAEVFYLVSLILLGTLLVLGSHIGVIGSSTKLEECLQAPCSQSLTQEVLEHCASMKESGQIVICASPEVSFDVPFFCEIAGRCPEVLELGSGLTR